MGEGFLAFQGVITEIIKKPNENKAEKNKEIETVQTNDWRNIVYMWRNMKWVS